jgi:ribonuclease HII
MKDLEQLLENISAIPEQNRANAFIIAMDEVGRGSFFGPVSVGGVLFSCNELLNTFVRPGSDDWRKDVRDSKKLKAPARQYLKGFIEKNYLCHVSHVSVNYINRYNINRAIQYGVYRTVCNLTSRMNRMNEKHFVPFVLLDGNYRFSYPSIRMKEKMPAIHSIIKGDDRVFHISCASIIAKEKRDMIIQKSALRFSGYGFEKNAGYGTLEHRQAILKKGATRFHRKEYIKNISVPLD